MWSYAPLPTEGQLEAVGAELGLTVGFDSRILGGLGGTIDVLKIGDRELAVLKRYWLPEPEEVSPAEGEFRALTLAAEHGIPAPSPLWIDRTGLFPERAILMSYLEGKALLTPRDELDWATKLAVALNSVHGISATSDDRELFPDLGHNDGHHSESEIIEGLLRHPRGMELWKMRMDAVGTLDEEPPVYLHHDFWPGNTLWRGEHLVAVVDWEGGAIGDPALDVAYCAFDIRMLGRDRAADHFVAEYRRLSGRPLLNLGYWELVALCRPLPDVAIWVPGWQALGFDITVNEARARYASLLTAAVERGRGRAASRR